MVSLKLTDLSKYRSEIMGGAILCIMLFHINPYITHSSKLSMFVFSQGYLGVDFFLLLSGMGLCFSKWESLNDYIIKRLIRILPTFWIVLLLFLITDVLTGEEISLIDYLIKATTLGFWTGSHYEYWYISAIIGYYMLFLFFRKLKGNRAFALVFLISLGVCLLNFYFEIFSGVRTNRVLFFSRVPIFLIGVYIGRIIKNRMKVEISYKYLYIGGFMILFFLLLCKINWEQFFRTGIILLTACGFIPQLTIVISKLLSKTPRLVNILFRFLGSITLELYLLHGLLLQHFHSTSFEIFLTFPLSILLAWMLNVVIKKFSNKIRCSYQSKVVL